MIRPKKQLTSYDAHSLVPWSPVPMAHGFSEIKYLSRSALNLPVPLAVLKLGLQAIFLCGTGHGGYSFILSVRDQANILAP